VFKTNLQFIFEKNPVCKDFSLRAGFFYYILSQII